MGVTWWHSTCGSSTLELCSHAGPFSRGFWKAGLSWALPSPVVSGPLAWSLQRACQVPRTVAQHTQRPTEAGSPLKDQTWNGYSTPSTVPHCSKQSHSISDSRKGETKSYLTKGGVIKNVTGVFKPPPLQVQWQSPSLCSRTPSKSPEINLWSNWLGGMHPPLNQSL